ncbi:hypothetical protein ES319_D07G100100v1 [Gossypium barbadense]|uniref:Uncharacterized protein n=1 Tax=Gossypium barbadense TaxID=3634 RepID=A0A5J5QPJ3_GOSBA|nr:hypothetical protein ES319_D07G100100v1 [Gossypium barbadense]
MLMGIAWTLISITSIVLLLILIPSVFNYKSQWNKWTLILHLVFVVVPLLLLIILVHFKHGLPSVSIYKNKLNFLRRDVGLVMPPGLLLVLLFFLIMIYKKKRLKL